MKVTLKKTINNEAWKNLNDKIERKVSMQVGWFPQAKYTESTSVAQVAMLNEFGGNTTEGKRIPPRPFMRPAAKENSKKWAGDFARDVKQSPVKYALDRLGFVVEGDVRRAISNVWEPPLHPITIYNRLKKQGAFQKENETDTHNAIMEKVSKAYGTHEGIAKPLIDTGYMIASITHRVGGQE